MTQPQRVTAAEIKATIAEAKAAGAVRVSFDGGRIVVELERLDEPETLPKQSEENTWVGAR